jgi:thiol-disulfide isomerase/thioredoxin
MRIFVLAALAILMLGCAAQEGSKTPENVSKPSPEEPEPQKIVNTSNLSFNRTTTDVLTADTKFPEPLKFDFSNKTTEDGRLIVYYFKSSGCSACKELQPEIDRLMGKYTEVEWHIHDIVTQNGTIAYTQFADQYNLSPDKRLVPQALVDGSIITDRFNINNSLEGIIVNFSENDG